jgi:hypothetical protein
VWIANIVCSLLRFFVSITFSIIDLEDELNKQFFRLASNSLQVREVVGEVFSQREPI